MTRRTSNEGVARLIYWRKLHGLWVEGVHNGENVISSIQEDDVIETARHPIEGAFQNEGSVVIRIEDLLAAATLHDRKIFLAASAQEVELALQHQKITIKAAKDVTTCLVVMQVAEDSVGVVPDSTGFDEPRDAAEGSYRLGFVVERRFVEIQFAHYNPPCVTEKVEAIVVYFLSLLLRSHNDSSVIFCVLAAWRRFGDVFPEIENLIFFVGISSNHHQTILLWDEFQNFVATGREVVHEKAVNSFIHKRVVSTQRRLESPNTYILSFFFVDEGDVGISTSELLHGAHVKMHSLNEVLNFLCGLFLDHVAEGVVDLALRKLRSRTRHPFGFLGR